jgi:hypothetical protein
VFSRPKVRPAPDKTHKIDFAITRLQSGSPTGCSNSTQPKSKNARKGFSKRKFQEAHARSNKHSLSPFRNPVEVDRLFLRVEFARQLCGGLDFKGGKFILAAGVQSMACSWASSLKLLTQCHYIRMGLCFVGHSALAGQLPDVLRKCRSPRVLPHSVFSQ